MEIKRKKVTVTMEQKVQALFRIDAGESLTKIAQDLGVGKQTVSDWKKNRKDIEDFCAKMVSMDSLGDRSTLKKPKNQTLDEALYVWFCQQHEQGISLSGITLQAMALSLNEKLKGDPAFTASMGWLSRWKNRHGVRELSVSSEMLSGDNVESENLKLKLKFEKFVSDKNLQPCQVFNADETGLSYKMLPKKILTSKMYSVAKDHKVKEERVTLLLCSNASGDLKLPLLVIGKSGNPKALKNVNMNALPAHYISQKSAWMNGKIFKDWFFDKFVPTTKIFLKEKKLPEKAVLFIDNTSCHPSEEELRDGEIVVKYPSSNATTLIQPLGQGVIEATKRLYKKKFILFLLKKQKSDPSANFVDILKKVTIKTVIYLAAEAWEEIKPTTLQKSWKKLWPRIPLENQARDENQPTSNDAANFVQVFKEFKGCAVVKENDISEWMNSDTDISPQVLNEDEIAETCIAMTTTEIDSLEDDDDGMEESTSPIHGEAATMLEKLISYFEKQSDTSTAELQTLRRLRNRVAKRRQSS